MRQFTTLKDLAGTAHNLWDNLLSSGIPGDRRSPLMRRIRFANIFGVTTVAALLAFGLINLLSAEYLGFGTELAAGLFGITILLQLRASGNIGRAQTQILLDLTIVMSYLFASGGIARTGIFWWFTFPVAAFFIEGRRRGWLWVSVVVSEILAMMVLGAVFHARVPYSVIELRQFLAAFLVITVVVQHYEGMRDDYEKSMETSQRKYSAANTKLEKEAEERVKAEVLLSASEQQYHAIFESLSDIYYKVTMSGIIQIISPSVYDRAGYRPEELIGRNVMEIYANPEERDRLISVLREKHSVSDYEIDLLTKDGKILRSTLNSHLVFDEQKIPAGIEGMVHNIDQRKKAEKALRESEERYSLVLQALDDGLWDWNVPTGKAYFSERYYALLGYDNCEFPSTYDVWLTLIHPQDITAVKKELYECIESGRGFSIDLRMKTKSGDWKWVCTRGKVMVRDSQGKAVRMTGTLSDSSRRKQAEESLRNSEEKFRLLFEQARDIIIMLDLPPDGPPTIRDANQTALRNFGYTHDEIVGQPITFLEGDEKTGSLAAERARRAQANDGVLLQMKHRRKDGTTFDAEASVKEVTIGGMRLAVSIERDITSRKQAEQELKTSEERYRMLVDHQGEGIVNVDFEEMITYCNPASESIFGVPAGTLAGRRITEFITIESAEKLAKETSQRKQGNKSKYELEIIQPAGERRLLLVTAVPQTGAEGQSAGTLAILQDITSQKRAERLQTALYHISEAAVQTDNLDKLYSEIHKTVAGLISTRNFFITLYHEKEQTLSFPYYVDEFDAPPLPRKMGRGLNEYVLKTGTPLLVTAEMQTLMAEQGKIATIGTPSVDWAGVPMRAGGRVIGIIGVQSYSQDIRFGEDTLSMLGFMSDNIALAIDRKRAEEERKRLVTELGKLTTAVEQSASVIVITDLEANIVYVNQAFVDLTGYSREEAMGRNPRILKSGEMDPSAYQQMWQVLTSGGRWQGEFHNKKKNGDLYWEQATITSIRDEQGEPALYMAVKEDTTMKRALEEERERLIAELQDSLDNIKTLKGLVPICASCKKIRDDSGYWQQVEEYVAKNTEAEFSHGLCDECAHKLYPDYFADKKNKEKE